MQNMIEDPNKVVIKVIGVGGGGGNAVQFRHHYIHKSKMYVVIFYYFQRIFSVKGFKQIIRRLAEVYFKCIDDILMDKCSLA